MANNQFSGVMSNVVWVYLQINKNIFVIKMTLRECFSDTEKLVVTSVVAVFVFIICQSKRRAKEQKMKTVKLTNSVIYSSYKNA